MKLGRWRIKESNNSLVGSSTACAQTADGKNQGWGSWGEFPKSAFKESAISGFLNEKDRVIGESGDRVIGKSKSVIGQIHTDSVGDAARSIGLGITTSQAAVFTPILNCISQGKN